MLYSNWDNIIEIQGVKIMKIYSKFDYTKSPRKQVTTTINKDLHKKFKSLSIQCDQPTSKMYDVLLMQLFEGDNEDKINEFINNVKNYR
jgi:hypothetical protein